MTNYRVPIESTFSWQRPVADRATAPAGGESKGHRYLVIATATGVFTGHEGDIAWYDGSNWQFDSPSAGFMVYVVDEEEVYLYTTSWATFASMSASVYDSDADGKIDPAAGGTGINSSAASGMPKVTAGVWSVDATLDDLSDGATYGKVKGSEIDSGQVKQVRAVVGTTDVSGDNILLTYSRMASYDAGYDCLLFEI